MVAGPKFVWFVEATLFASAFRVRANREDASRTELRKWVELVDSTTLALAVIKWATFEDTDWFGLVVQAMVSRQVSFAPGAVVAKIAAVNDQSIVLDAPVGRRRS